ncbi:MAG: signal peptidase I [Proteobacteria bacterium]|uniref:signal peptidase I n=1 Tax=Rudaea sp. TaxID=2136325 RepID=UPI00321FEB03|nr:signal peptidase I [Pseudomonadota bacterium]
MDFDFALLLVVLTFATGITWLFDRLFLYKGRATRAQALGAVGGTTAEREQRVAEAMREPAIVEYARSFFPVILIVLTFRSFLAEPFKIPSGSMMPTLLVGDFILVNKFAYGLRVPVLNTKFIATGEPKRGDVFVFIYPGYSCTRDGKEVRSGRPCDNGEPLVPVPKMNYIKRVIGLPGDTITYRNKTLYVNGKEIPSTYTGPYVGSGGEGQRMAGASVREEMLPGVEHRILNAPADRGFSQGREGEWIVPAGHYFAMGDNRDNSEDSRYWGFVPEQNLVGRAFVVWMNWDGGIDFKRLGTLIK